MTAARAGLSERSWIDRRLDVAGTRALYKASATVAIRA